MRTFTHDFGGFVRLAALLAATAVPRLCPAAESGIPVTAGWKNVHEGRDEIRVADSNLLWRQELKVDSGVRLERRNGAEGSVVFKGGKLYIRKTNHEGELVVEAPSFVLKEGLTARFSADVSVFRAAPYRSHGMLRVIADDGALGVQSEVRHMVGGNARNISGGLVEQPRGMYYRKWCHYRGKGKAVRPLIVISGDPSLSVWKNWTAEDTDDSAAAFLADRAESAKRRVDPKRVTVSAEEVARSCRESVDHTARIVVEGGVPNLVIDGRRVPAAAYHAVYPHCDLSEMTAGQPVTAGGVPLTVAWIFGGRANFPVPKNWKESAPFDARHAADVFRGLMRGDTNALYMIGFDCNPPRDFIRRDHPGEAWIGEDGKPVYGSWSTTAPRGADTGDENAWWPWPSMASPAWRDEIKRNIRSLVAELKRTGHAKKVVGVHFIGFEDGQFNMSRPDYSDCARKAYGQYVRLNPQLSTNYWQFCRQLGVLAQSEFARVFKQAMGKDVIAVRWDSAPFVVDYAHGTMNRDPGGIDVCVTQPTYAERWPGHPEAPYVPWSSLALHGKMHWYEMDLRSWWINVQSSLPEASGVGNSPDDPHWCTVYRRLAGEMLAQRSGFWFFDMGRGWFAGAGIAADIADSMKTMKYLAEKKPSPWKPDVAVVVDEEGLFGVEGGKNFPWPSHIYSMCERQLSYLSAAGIPYEFFLAEDVIANPRLLEDKKTTLFVYWRHFDEKRVSAIKAASGPGRTQVFLAESGCLGGAREATGFDIGYETRRARPYRLVPEPGFGESLVSTFECEMHRGWPVPENHGKFFYEASGRQVWVKEDGGTIVHARYAWDTNRVAVAERRDGAGRRWYVATPGGLTPELFLRIVRESRGYTPVDRVGLSVNMNGDFISVHAVKGGIYDFRLPFPCSVVNVRSGREERVRNGVMRLNVTPGETCWFLLERRWK